MRAHYDYEVNAEWVWSMVATHKIELSAARQELVAAGKNLGRHLQNLDILIHRVCGKYWVIHQNILNLIQQQIITIVNGHPVYMLIVPGQLCE